MDHFNHLSWLKVATSQVEWYELLVSVVVDLPCLFFYVFFKNTCRVHEKEDIIDQYEDESELFRDRNEKLKLEVLLIMTTCNNNKYTVHVGLEVCYF